ncbi:polysaccharide lyase family 14 protein, partial [Macrolepiota fuliginosa MF-IS2]
SWTTSPSSDALALSDSTFRPTDILKSLPHTYTSAPDGKKSMKAHYPKGSYNFGHQPEGGFSFYAPGPESVDLSTAKEATFGYSVYFPDGFDFQKGGKLPGIYGGDSDSEAVSCSGGRRDNGCFSARLMWRGEGAGELYTYLPPSFDANQKVCNVKPMSDCNPTYGASVGRGAFTFATGGWTTVSERIRLNDAGQTNGELELFVNGKSVINVGGLVLRDGASGKMRGIQMQTFFGGSSSDFATPKDQDVFFSDFSVAITEKL